MTYISLGYALSAVAVFAGLVRDMPSVIVIGVALLFATIYEAGKKQ